MVTRELLKREIDNIQEEYLGLLYEVIRAFEFNPPKTQSIKTNWNDWVEKMYGCLSEDKISRFSQGELEVRETLI